MREPEQNQKQEPAKIVVVFLGLKLSYFRLRLESDRFVLGREARLLVILL